jgi:hypothetical protein
MAEESRVRVYSDDNLQDLFGEQEAPSDDEQTHRSVASHRHKLSVRGDSRTPAIQSRNPSRLPTGSRSLGSPQLNVPKTAKLKKEHKRARLQQFWDEVQRSKQAGEKRAKHRRDKAREGKEKDFRDMINNLESEKQLVDEVKDYLLLKEATDARKKLQLYEQWSEHVFEPIQKSIRSELCQRNILDIEERKRKFYEEFLETVARKKGGVFRDIVIHDDYDPFQDHAHVIKYDVRSIDRNDPLRKEKNKVKREQKITQELDPNAKYLDPRPRKTLNILMWDKLDATPYARYEKAPKPGNSNIRKTTMVLDHYNVQASQDIVREEYFQRGKRQYQRTGFQFPHQKAYFGKPGSAASPSRTPSTPQRASSATQPIRVNATPVRATPVRANGTPSRVAFLPAVDG